MKIAIFASYYPPHVGGFERTVSELSERLAGAGYDIIVLTCDLGLDAPDWEIRNGVRVYRLPAYMLLGGTYVIPKPSLRTFRLLRQALSGRLDLIHTHTRFFPMTALGLLTSFIRRVPMLHTEHGAGHSAVASPFVRLMNLVVDHSLGWLVMKRATVVAISQAAANFCRHLGAKDVEVIPDGVVTDVFQPGDSHFRTQYGIAPDEIIIAFAGRLVWGKGVQNLLRAWPYYGGEQVRLVIAGRGPLRGELERISEEVGARTIFTGSLSTEELVSALRAADIFVSPTYTEGLGLTLIEAGAVGLPVVASGIEGVLDVVEDQVTGLLVLPGDIQALGEAVTQMVTNGELRQRMGQAATQSIRSRFDWRLTSSRYADAYNRIAPRHSMEQAHKRSIRDI